MKFPISRQAITKTWTMIIAMIIVVAAVGAGSYYYLTRPPAKTEILVGVAISQTGSYASAGAEALQGYKLWEKLVNKKGGILGVPVRLIIYDDKSDPATTKSLYERLITVDNVDFLLAPYSTACALAMEPVSEKYKIVTIHGATSGIKCFNQGYIYQFCAIATVGVSSQMPVPYFEFFKSLSAEQRPKTLALVNTADVFPREVASAVVSVAQKYGVDVVFHEEIEKGATDASTVVMKAKATSPDIFYCVGYFSEETLLIRTCKELGFNPKILITELAIALWPTLVSTLQETANYVWGMAAYDTRFPYPGNKEYVEAFNAEYGKNPTIYGAIGYVAPYLLETAIKAVGSYKNMDAIRDWLVENEVMTIIGRWKVDQKFVADGVKYVPVVETGGTKGQIINKTLEIVWPKEVATGNAVYPKPQWVD